MKVTLFTSNNYRHNYLINLLSNFCDELWVVQECKTLFTGKNDEKFQNKMVGTLLYKVIYSISSAISVPLCCEVNTVPLNTQSLNFHKKMEFQKIDEIPFGIKKVAMLIKE